MFCLKELLVLYFVNFFINDGNIFGWILKIFKLIIVNIDIRNVELNKKCDYVFLSIYWWVNLLKD